jgi:hypothetical protein
MRLQMPSGFVAPLMLASVCAGCAPSLHDFDDRILEPLAVRKADELAAGTRLRILKTFDARNQWPGERWFGVVYWGLDALGYAGYGLPGQGHLLEKLKEYYRRGWTEKRKAELDEMLLRIEEQKLANKTMIFQDLVRHTSEEFTLFGRIYVVCIDDVARRYRATGHEFRRLEDRRCSEEARAERNTDVH